MSPCPKAEFNAAGVNSRCNYKIVFKAALVAVVHQVDTGIYVVVPHLGIVGNIGVPIRPLVSNEVVARTMELCESDYFWLAIGVYQSHRHFSLTLRLILPCHEQGSPTQQFRTRSTIIRLPRF